MEISAPLRWRREVKAVDEYSTVRVNVPFSIALLGIPFNPLQKILRKAEALCQCMICAAGKPRESELVVQPCISVLPCC